MYRNPLLYIRTHVHVHQCAYQVSCLLLLQKVPTKLESKGVTIERGSTDSPDGEAVS